jgi:hypothetical protein
VGHDFLAFWRLTTLDDALQGRRLLNYAASNQYTRVSSGDTVWVVTVREGRLRLVGRVVVDRVVNRDEAVQALGTADIWEADHYILPVAGTVRPVTDIDIHHLVPLLQFGGTSKQLMLDGDGRVNGQHLQAMRVLAGNSPQILADAMGE